MPRGEPTDAPKLPLLAARSTPAAQLNTAHGSVKHSCSRPRAACNKLSRRVDRAAMGLEEGKVCVTSSAWESHRETTLLFSKSLAGSEPALKPASC